MHTYDTKNPNMVYALSLKPNINIGEGDEAEPKKGKKNIAEPKTTKIKKLAQKERFSGHQEELALNPEHSQRSACERPLSGEKELENRKKQILDGFEARSRRFA